MTQSSYSTEQPLKVSIIMPAYNVEQYIAEAIESVLQQTRPAFELIIINDGSTDGTREVIARYENHPLIKVVDKKNEGPGPTRNTGLALATGDYTYYFDADDLLQKDFLSYIEEVIRLHGDIDLIFFSGSTFLDASSRHDYRPAYQRKFLGLIGKKDYPNTLLHQSASYFCSPCLYVARRQFLQSNQLVFKAILHEDEEIIFPMISLAESAYVTDQVFFYRRIRNGSIMTSTPGPKNLEALVAVFYSHHQFCLAHGQDPFFDRMVYEARMRHFFRQFIYQSKKLGYPGRIGKALQMIIKTRQPGLLAIMIKSAVPEQLKTNLMRLLRR